MRPIQRSKQLHPQIERSALITRTHVPPQVMEKVNIHNRNTRNRDQHTSSNANTPRDSARWETRDRYKNASHHPRSSKGGSGTSSCHSFPHSPKPGTPGLFEWGC